MDRGGLDSFAMEGYFRHSLRRPEPAPALPPIGYHARFLYPNEVPAHLLPSPTSPTVISACISPGVRLARSIMDQYLKNICACPLADTGFRNWTMFRSRLGIREC